MDSLLEDLEILAERSGLKKSVAKQIYKELLNEFALSKHKLEERIECISRELQTHVIKLLIFCDKETNLEHWETEVANWCNVFVGVKIKSNKKPLSPDKIYDLLDIFDENVFKAIGNNICIKYKTVNLNLDYNKFVNVMKQITMFTSSVTVDDIDKIIRG